MIRGNDRARFMSKVDQDGPVCRPDLGACWLWLGWTTGEYGRFTVAKRHWLAHRWLYEQTVGPIPEGLQLDLLCRTRSCVNPAHLEPVTNRENARRGEVGSNMSGKTHCAQGHEFTSPNTGRDKHGWRFCRTCRRLGEANRRAARVAS